MYEYKAIITNVVDGDTFDIAVGATGTTAAYTVKVVVSSGMITGATVSAK